MLVLGIDPGTRVTGYGAVVREGGRFVCASRGLIRPPQGDDLARRLLFVHDRLTQLVAELHPDVIAVEDCFYAKNLRSTLKLGHVKGLVLLVAARGGVPVHEYAPRQIKQSVVGRGGASKEQVRFMIERLVVGSVDEAAREPASLDLTDALAVAVCHHHQATGPAARVLGA
jgi:crossover junction endodeoxyribonuclease RuvC